MLNQYNLFKRMSLEKNSVNFTNRHYRIRHYKHYLHYLDKLICFMTRNINRIIFHFLRKCVCTHPTPSPLGILMSSALTAQLRINTEDTQATGEHYKVDYNSMITDIISSLTLVMGCPGVYLQCIARGRRKIDSRHETENNNIIVMLARITCINRCGRHL